MRVADFRRASGIRSIWSTRRKKIHSQKNSPSIFAWMLWGLPAGFHRIGHVRITDDGIVMNHPKRTPTAPPPRQGTHAVTLHHPNRTPPALPPRQCTHGLTLVEVMVAIVVLSIGLLGIAGLQAATIKYKINTW